MKKTLLAIFSLIFLWNIGLAWNVDLSFSLKNYVTNYTSNLDKSTQQYWMSYRIKKLNSLIKQIDAQLEQVEQKLKISVSSKKTVLKNALLSAKNLINNNIKKDYDNLINSLTLEQKIWQMIMIWFDGTWMDEKTFVDFRVKEQINSGAIWGVIIYGRNIASPDKLKDFISWLKNTQSPIPLFVAVDQEWGKVQRLRATSGFKDFPSQKTIAADYDLSWAYEVYKDMWKLLKDYGFNFNLAPVVDVDVNPNSPVIWAKERSYSYDPEKVVDYASQAIEAYRQLWLISSLKHFPWHWSATADSHSWFTDITTTWSERELIPYKELISKWLVDTIMSSHVYHKKIDSLNTASLSETFINKILRKWLWFTWVVITDDMDMWAVANIYPQEEAIIRAVNAWNDILIFSNYVDPNPDMPYKATDIIIKAIRQWKIDPKRIDESFERIMKLKVNLW